MAGSDSAGKQDFGGELAKVLPFIIREFTRQQMSVFSRGFVTVPQVVILEILAEQGTCKMGDLARALNFTMSAVTGIIDKMIKLRLLKRERSSKDRRVVKVMMLKKGEETVKLVREERRSAANNIFSALTEKEKSEYLKILRKVRDNLK